MKDVLTEKIDIFLIVSPQAIEEHFNKNDPSPLYKRQLSHEFEEYINRIKAPARKHTVIEYKITCKTDDDKQYTEPLIYAIKRHFSDVMITLQTEFERFKRRNYLILSIGLGIILLSHVFIPMMSKDEGAIESAILMGIDIFSWVMMWQPIDNLLFHCNRQLREIVTIKKLTEAEIVYTE
ncbi:MAG TPA: hypothetical protein VK489_08665 [Ferruginibacter sp.]|nr:hypothetical protein [Ferruginibacter sp.]